ncbi:MAG: FKBP-type peptidyl-prolyl cis-trans isomerase [Verrucomicrobiota bacterium]|jgi:FKBP-type peptidyl-prolyl cis-trans isomerase
MAIASPIRSFFILLLLGVLLMTLALVVRSGIFELKTHDEPINTAMRSAMAEKNPQLSTEDSLTVDRLYSTAQKLPSGLRYIIRNFGTGDKKPRSGDMITVHYVGHLLDGSAIDSSYQGGASLTFRIGEGRVIPGWEDAIPRMKKGEKRTLIVPYWLGYGIQGKPPTVPSKATLVFDIELLDF